MEYLYETHLHTAETSRCGQSPAKDMVSFYKDRGFDGIIVTDHFVNGYSYANFEGGWKDRIDAYLRGYRAAREAGEKLGIKVFLSWEYTYQGKNGEDYLIYGLGEDFLYAAKDCDRWDIYEYAAAVRQSGGILVRAHPYRVAGYIEQPGILRPGAFDAVEVFNAGNASRLYDDQALSYARRHNLPTTAGSDTHCVTTAGQGYISFDRPMNTIKELACAIMRREARLVRAPRAAAS